MSFNIKSVFIILLSTVISSCANTSLVESWNEADLVHAYHRPMIVAISDSQQTRQIYEKYFVAELKKINVIATPSYKLISSKLKINRENIVAAIQGENIDSVLVTYLVSAETEVKRRDSPLNTGYSADVDSNQISATIVSNRGRSRDEEVYVLKSDFYGVDSKSLIWSARTKTVGPESVDEVVTDVTSLLIKELLSDGILK